MSKKSDIEVEEPPGNQITDWLEKLQQESWNLELLISGFSIFLLIQAQGAINDFDELVSANYHFENSFYILVYGLLKTLKLGSSILTINLLVHILVRGFWIGAIGLRSVQKKLDFDQLKYSPLFTKRLSKKVLSLDVLLTRLDTLSSVIFAFTFLVIFMFFSLFIGLAFFGGLSFILRTMDGWTGAAAVLSVISGILMVLLLLSALIYLLDTLSLGFFKKYKWLSKLYYPIYIFWSFITFSFIYRGIYYSLINRFSKTKIRLFFVPYLLSIFFIPLHKIDHYVFFPDNNTKFEINSNYYDNMRKEGKWIGRVSIPSQLVNNKLLPLFIRYDVRFNEDVQKGCPDFKPTKEAGLISGITFDNSNISLSTPSVIEEEPDKLIQCLADHFLLYFNDSIPLTPGFYYFEHPNKGEKGLYTMLHLDSLSSGENVLLINRKSFENDTIKEVEYARVPFWIE